MDTFLVRRRVAWSTREELQATAHRSNVVGDEMPDDVRWIRSYVVDDDGQLGTVCVYQATSQDALREHAERVGMPADEISSVVETVLVRSDPPPKG